MTVPAENVGTARGGGGLTRLHRLIGPVAGAVVGVATVVLAQSIAEPNIETSFSPRWWPELLGVLITLLSVGLGVKEAVRPSTRDGDINDANRAGAIKVAASITAVIAYGFLWYYLDFRIATLILFIALVWILGGRGWKATLLFPSVCTAILYTLFGLLLKVPL
jgi:hypothetical protein